MPGRHTQPAIETPVTPLGSTQALPNEILQLVAQRITSRRTLAACTLVSNAFLEVFGRELYRSVTLWAIRHRQWAAESQARNPFRAKFLSFVEVLEITRHDSSIQRTSCTGIDRLCTGLKTLIVEDTKWLCGSSDQCGCLASNRPVKLVIRRQNSPLLGIPFDLLPRNFVTTPQSPERDARCGIRETTIEFGEWRSGFWIHHIPSSSNPDISTVYTANVPINRLSIVFRPLVPASMEKLYAPRSNAAHPCFVDLSEPLVVSTTKVSKDRYDLCSTLALVCLSTPPDCDITVANIDQFPIRVQEDGAECYGSTRSHTGLPLQTVDPQTRLTGEVFNISPSGSCGLSCPVDSKHCAELERQLQERAETVRGMTKRWIRALLDKAGKEETWADRWSRIKWVTLKEYLEEPGRTDEWFNDRNVDEWI